VNCIRGCKSTKVPARFRDSVQATPYRNKAEAMRWAHERWKVAERAGANWSAVIKAAGGDVEGYVMTELNRIANREAEHV
jgi:hypothetical protein